MTPDEILEQIFNELHSVAGICGHCGKRNCHDRSSNSYLPGVLNTDDAINAITKVIAKAKKTDAAGEL